MDIIKDKAGYHKSMIKTDESNFPCTRTLLKILGFKEIQEKAAKLPPMIFKFIPYQHYIWVSDKYASPITAASNFDGYEHGFFWAASKSEEAIKQLQEAAKQAVGIYLGHYSKEWARTRNHSIVDKIDFDLIKKQTEQDLANVLAA